MGSLVAFPIWVPYGWPICDTLYMHVFMGICNNLHEIGYLHDPAERPPYIYIGISIWCAVLVFYFIPYLRISIIHLRISKNRRINGYPKINYGYAKIDLWIT